MKTQPPTHRSNRVANFRLLFALMLATAALLLVVSPRQLVSALRGQPSERQKASAARHDTGMLPRLAAAAACTTPPPDMVGWWPGETDASDIQGTNNGTSQGAVSFPAGEVGQAFSFNGSDADVKVPAASSMNVGSGNGLTLDLWINPTSASTTEPLIEWNNPAAGTPYGTHLWLSVAAAGDIYPNLIDTNGTFHPLPSAPGLIVAGVYQHIALTYDKTSGIATLYRNGVIVAGPTNLGSFTPQTSYDLYFGLRPAPAASRFTGSMDEIELFNRALSQAEIQSIYNADTAGKCKTPAVSIGDASLTPGFGGATNMIFNISVARPNANGVTVDYATADGTAQQPTDYTSTSGTLIIPANTSSATISVPVVGLARSANQTFSVNLSNPSNAGLNRSSAVGTIRTANADVSADGALPNPNGVWAYGWSGTLTSTLNPYGNGSLDGFGNQVWGSTPGDFNNPSNNQQSVLPPHTAAFHPGPSGEFSHFVWTAPVDGSFSISATFTSLDSGGTDVHILDNNVSLFSGAVTSGNPQSFSGVVTVVTGDKIDFAVGDGGNGFLSDMTGISATISSTSASPSPSPSPTPTPATTISSVSGSGTYGSTGTLTATLTSNSSGVSGKSVSFTLNSNPVGSATTNGSGVATLTGVSLSGINAGPAYSNAVGASFAGDAGYLTSSGTGDLTVSKATPVITWSNPANIVYGTALSGTQLNASASVTGAAVNPFVYTPPSGTVLHASDTQNLHVVFTPDDTTNYNTATKDVSINVTKATLTITADDKAKGYRAANPMFTFTPTGFVNGDTASILSGTPALTTTATATSVVNTYSITIIQNTVSAVHNTFDDYSFSFVNGILTINKATPVISWSNPTDITYGAALNGTQLNATATNPNDGSAVTGTFTYNPVPTSVLHAGNGQVLATNFAPSDATDYNAPAQKTVSINVTKATLTVTADNKGRPFNTANPTLTFTPNGFVNGDTATVFGGTTPGLSTTAVTASPVGDYPISIIPGALTANDYSFTFVNGTLSVGKTVPVINWSNPGNMTYGTALTDTQLNATATDPNTSATVAGTFTYSPVAGTVFHVGSGQMLTVNFVPSNTANYATPSQKTVSMNVTRATLIITADNKAKSYLAVNPGFTFTPSGFLNGDTVAVLNGTTPGFSTTATALSTVNSYPITLSPGTLAASDYMFSFASGTLTVNKATPVINWSNPADITFGTALGAAQLNATAANPNDGSSVAGTFTYNPLSGAGLNGGNNQTLAGNFAPSDASNYNTPAQKTASINVLSADQTITFGALANKVFGDAPFAVSATTTPSGLPVSFSILSGPATINGSTVTITSAGQVIVHATQSGNSNYNAAPSTDQSFLVASAPVTPINGRFLFADRDSNNLASIFSMNANGSNLKKYSLPESYFPVWSPDGTKVAFSARWLSNQNVHLSMMNADGTNVLNLAGYESAQQVDGIKAWSPDGQWIAMNCDTTGSGFSFLCVRKVYDVYSTISVPRISIQSLTDPAWSPDSKKIVFAANDQTVFPFISRIYVYDLVSKIETRLTTGSGDFTPNWSPDGTKILFARATGIWVMNANGGNQKQLTTGQAFSPKWSLDMKQIAFISSNSIFVMNADGTNQTKVYTGTAISGFDWQLAPINVTTPTGSGASVTDGSVTLSFSNVGTGGTTSVIPITPSSAGSLPGGFAIDGNSLAFDVTTTASYTAPVEVCFNVPSLTGETAAQFNARRVMHGEGGVLVDRTSRHDFAAHLICANVNSLSPFAITTSLNPPTTNEIDDNTRFVQQHYLDFLDRQPDASGLNFWTNNITRCGTNQQCLEVQRINTSASFFLSIEFQQEGFLIERAYKAAYGEDTGSSALNGTHQLAVPIVRFNQLLSDAQEIGQGVVVNQGNWQQQLEDNKNAFMLDFVQRTGFTDANPNTLTPEQFVNKLFANAGVTPSSSDLAIATGRFASAPTSADPLARAKALRDVTENSGLVNAEMNRAFVLMEYFGYLRRNPNEGQDADYTGYDFWLRKLNQFNGNFIDAEMVRAFISSKEYRQRFGPN